MYEAGQNFVRARFENILDNPCTAQAIGYGLLAYVRYFPIFLKSIDTSWRGW
jgi:hypothetical protein